MQNKCKFYSGLTMQALQVIAEKFAIPTENWPLNSILSCCTTKIRFILEMANNWETIQNVCKLLNANSIKRMLHCCRLDCDGHISYDVKEIVSGSS